MPQSESGAGRAGDVHEEYVLGVRILETNGDGVQYRFDAPDHATVEFEDAAAAELYADVYFDVNGFVEDGTGERGVPPAVVQGGTDTLAAYLVAQSGMNVNWVASFCGRKPGQVEQYLSAVQSRAAEIRHGVSERDVAQ
ncbi:hypothetical protein [Halobacterium noricense]|uniref:hypothetical protein n=1 Tax=Halobacterium noricense TaxID=223182 RepID=UPI001E56FD21|nr:hypothetical protein [Halobacterium noricense]UHH24643.1 hypothetical protein LT974_11705 [Halobacterium noricense]